MNHYNREKDCEKEKEILLGRLKEQGVSDSGIEYLAEAYEALGEKTKAVLCYRLGVYDNEIKSYQQTAEYFGVTEARIRSIELKFFGKARPHARRTCSLKEMFGE